MDLPWHNSASEMFVKLNIKSFGEQLRVFVHGLLYLGILCCQVFAIQSMLYLFEVMGLVANITVCSLVTSHIRIFSEKSLN